MRFDHALAQPRQKNSWSCLPASLAWSARALGADVETSSLGLAVLRSKVITPRGYLVDKTGHDIAGFGADVLAGAGLATLYVYESTFDQVAAEAGLYGLVIGSGSWLHYAAVRDYDPIADVLLLANSSPGWKRIGQTMNRREFRRYAPISLTRIASADLIGQIGDRLEHQRRTGHHDDLRVPTLYVPRVGEGWAPSDPAGGLPTRLLGPADRGGLHQLRRQQPLSGAGLGEGGDYRRLERGA